MFRFALRAEGEGSALVFTHVSGDAQLAAQTAAGWECYLDRLDAQLTGEYLSEERAHEPVGERHERYAARFGLDPAPGRTFIAGRLARRRHAATRAAARGHEMRPGVYPYLSPTATKPR